MDRYAQYHGYREQYESLEGDEAESSKQLSRRYIPREREVAEEKLRRDYFGDENTPPIYPKEYFQLRLKFLLRVCLLMIRVKRCRPMGIKDIASWDLDNNTWGGWGEVIGTVLVSAGAQESSLGEMGVIGEIGGKSC
nr:hypothetical protein [Tanacetum cinerariifolium]